MHFSDKNFQFSTPKAPKVIHFCLWRQTFRPTSSYSLHIRARRKSLGQKSEVALRWIFYTEINKVNWRNWLLFNRKFKNTHPRLVVKEFIRMFCIQWHTHIFDIWQVAMRGKLLLLIAVCLRIWLCPGYQVQVLAFFCFWCGWKAAWSAKGLKVHNFSRKDNS